MPETGVTKQVLAYALREQIKDRALSKITVGDICAACDMNRKSFYYHFRDKNDLVCWIFQTDVANFQKAKKGDPLENILAYLAKNRTFYRAVLLDKGQNSFYDNMPVMLGPIVERRMTKFATPPEDHEETKRMLLDALRTTLILWINNYDDSDWELYLKKTARCGELVAEMLRQPC